MDTFAQLFGCPPWFCCAYGQPTHSVVRVFGWAKPLGLKWANQRVFEGLLNPERITVGYLRLAKCLLFFGTSSCIERSAHHKLGTALHQGS